MSHSCQGLFLFPPFPFILRPGSPQTPARVPCIISGPSIWHVFPIRSCRFPTTYNSTRFTLALFCAALCGCLCLCLSLTVAVAVALSAGYPVPLVKVGCGRGGGCASMYKPQAPYLFICRYVDMSGMRVRWLFVNILECAPAFEVILGT